jgi:hypothetical protein
MGAGQSQTRRLYIRRFEAQNDEYKVTFIGTDKCKITDAWIPFYYSGAALMLVIIILFILIIIYFQMWYVEMCV